MKSSDDNNLEAIKTTGTLTLVVGGANPHVEGAAIGTKQTTESDTDWFSLGRIKVGTEQRLVVGSISGRLYINAPFVDASATDAFDAYPGDDKRIDTCANKFANVDRFRGLAYLPNSEPQFDALKVPKKEAGKK